MRQVTVCQDKELSRPTFCGWTSMLGSPWQKSILGLNRVTPNAAMLFDCWTPAGPQGRGNYAPRVQDTRQASELASLRRGGNEVIDDGLGAATLSVANALRFARN